MTNLIADIEKEINKLEMAAQKQNVGIITEISDGVVKAIGLSNVVLNELVIFPNNLSGLAVNLGEDVVGIIVFGNYKLLRQGDQVTSTGKILEIPVGPSLAGRVVDALAQPIDGKGKFNIKDLVLSPVEKVAPGVIERESVNTPLQTGIKAIDSMIPIGKGQRELIIGDRGVGKTAIAIDTIINQKDVICIYVAIGQKMSKIAQIVDVLAKNNSLDHTIVVAAPASDSAAMQFIAAYTGCTIGEYFAQKGLDALVVYDDLTKHAWAYRQLSLTLRRPSGREAYPGDIFYLHSRLLERAVKFSQELGGGSLTALPIIETQAGDVSAYIPTNIISITDGQIYLESDLFFAGVRPAVNVGLSVSRVGGSAQIKAMKSVAGSLRLDLAQYRELAAFAQFGSDLDESTRLRLERGKRIVEVLKQPQFQPIPVGNQIIMIWAVTTGYLDKINEKNIADFEKQFFNFLTARYPKIITDIESEKIISEKNLKLLEKSIAEFSKGFTNE